jgi:hypothetical protein
MLIGVLMGAVYADLFLCKRIEFRLQHQPHLS